MPVIISNQMTSCSWTIGVNGTFQTIAAGASITQEAQKGETIQIITPATSGSCSVSSTNAGANSASPAPAECVLNTTLTSSALTLIIGPASGQSPVSNAADNTVITCP
jgi:hypothetical protein